MPLTPSENRFRSASSARSASTATRVSRRSGLRSSPNAANTARRSMSAARSRSTGKTRGEVERFYESHSNMEQQSIRLLAAQERRSAENIMARGRFEPNAFSPDSGAFSPQRSTATRLFFPNSTPGRSSADAAPSPAPAPAKAIVFGTVEKQILHDSIKEMIQIEAEKREDIAEIDERNQMVEEAQAEERRLLGERVLHLDAQFAAIGEIWNGGRTEFINAMQSSRGKVWEGITLPKEVGTHFEELTAINGKLYELELEISNHTEELPKLSNAMKQKATKFDNLLKIVRDLHTKHSLAQANIGRHTDVVMKHCFHLANDLHEEHEREAAEVVLYSIFSMKLDDIVEALLQQEADDEPFELEVKRRSQRPANLRKATFVEAQKEAMAFARLNFVLDPNDLGNILAIDDRLCHVDQLHWLNVRQMAAIIRYLVVTMKFVESPNFTTWAKSKTPEQHEEDGVAGHVARCLGMPEPTVHTKSTKRDLTIDRMKGLLRLSTERAEDTEEQDGENEEDE